MYVYHLLTLIKDMYTHSLPIDCMYISLKSLPLTSCWLGKIFKDLLRERERESERESGKREKRDEMESYHLSTLLTIMITMYVHPLPMCLLDISSHSLSQYSLKFPLSYLIWEGKEEFQCVCMYAYVCMYAWYGVR